MGHTLDQTSSALSPKCKFENVEHKMLNWLLGKHLSMGKKELGGSHLIQVGALF